MGNSYKGGPGFPKRICVHMARILSQKRENIQNSNSSALQNLCALFDRVLAVHVTGDKYATQVKGATNRRALVHVRSHLLTSVANSVLCYTVASLHESWQTHLTNDRQYSSIRNPANPGRIARHRFGNHKSQCPSLH